MELINIAEKLNGEQRKININELYDKLIDEYDEEDKKGLNYYEFFDMVNNNFKPHYDFDLSIDFNKKDDINLDNIKKNILSTLNKITNSKDKDYSIIEDHRPYKNNKYKYSIHFINYKNKTNFKNMKKLIKIVNYYLNPFDIKLDSSIYRTGLSKFRLPYTKKDGDNESLAKPLNNTSKSKFKNHIVQYVKNIKNELKINPDILKDFNENFILSKKEVLEEYTITKTKIKGNFKFHYIKERICPFIGREHKSNNLYIVEVNGNLILKCFDELCNNKSKMLFKQENNNNKNFDKYKFNSFKIGSNESNYNKKREYFELFYKYFRDNDVLYRVENDYNNEIGYYECNLIEIKKNGLKDLKYQKRIINKKGEEVIKNFNFIKTYTEDDQTRKEYFKLAFKPNSNNDNNDKIYNLFDGFNYVNMLNVHDEITEQDKKDLEFLLDFIKNNVCDGRNDYYDYFISHFATIIQTPGFLTHMILILYSNEGGTGKSNFFKFIGKIIGDKYSYYGSMEQIIESHSTAHLGRLINIIEEMKNKKLTSYYEDLKDYSQRDKAPYNPKGQKQYSVKCCVRYFMTTNEILKIPRKDRRLFVYEFKKLKNKKDIRRIDDIYENKKIYFLFGEYLKNYKIKIKKRYEWIENKPMTPPYKLFLSNNSIDYFLRSFYLINENIYDNFEELRSFLYKTNNNLMRIKKNKFYDYYKDFCKNMGMNKKQKQNFYKEINNEYNNIFEEKIIKGIYTYKINLELLNDHLDIENKFINRYLLTDDELKKLNNEEDDELIEE